MKHDIATIKEIVNRFYRGEATPEEIAQATDYFKAVSNPDPSLMDDRRIFLALNQASETINMPDGLEQNVINATIGQRRKPRILPWAISTISAAAVIALVFIASPIETIQQERVGSPITEFAEIGNSESKTEEIIISQPSEEEEPEVASTETERPTPKQSVASIKRKTLKQPQRKTETHPTPTKQEKEAARLSIELINRALGKADIACANAEETFIEIEQTLNN